VLMVEVTFRQMEAGWNQKRYWSKAENVFDMLVMLVSAACLFIYLWDFRHKDSSKSPETAMVVARIARDVLRICRTVYFAKTVLHSIVDFRQDDLSHPHEEDDPLHIPGDYEPMSPAANDFMQYGEHDTYVHPPGGLSDG